MATILVTGASGYLASWIVKYLLDQGHTVHGTVRSLAHADKLQHLQRLRDEAEGRLHLFEADLLAEGSFDTAMADCSVVIHVASPYFLEKTDHPKRDLIDPAVQGTKNVLGSVNRIAGVTRVVLTSSIIALYGRAIDAAGNPGHLIGEHDRNQSSTIATNPYGVSKTQAEQAAWEIAGAQQRWQMVSVHPGVIFGPSLSRRMDATSAKLLLRFLGGGYRTGVPGLWLGVVDVRDAALAHVRAATCDAAGGRYIAVAESITPLQIADCIRRSHPRFQPHLPRRQVPKWLVWLLAPTAGLTREYVTSNVGHPIHFDQRRTREQLGIAFRQVCVTLADHVQQVLDDGLLAH